MISNNSLLSVINIVLEILFREHTHEVVKKNTSFPLIIQFFVVIIKIVNWDCEYFYGNETSTRDLLNSYVFSITK